MAFESADTSKSGEIESRLRQSALDHLWFPAHPWEQLLDSGGFRILTEGKGIKVKDIQGKWYYDGLAGATMMSVGHRRPEIIEAIEKQLGSLHFANLTFANASIPVIKLAERLASLTPGDLNYVLFTNSGSEAVETALKVAYQYHVNRGEPQRLKFVARKGGFHGMTLGALSLTSAGRFAHREIFDPLLSTNVRLAPQPLLYHCEFGSTSQSECDVRCAEATEEIVVREGPDTVAAIIAEPVSTSAGVAVPGAAYWPMLREICDKYGILLIADEVITGFGRTGKWFGIEHWDIVPDLMTVAKGITSGYFPLGACIARQEIHEAFRGEPQVTLYHTPTYAGHAVGAAAALANIDIIERDGLVANSASVGAYMLNRLMALKEHPTVGDVRGLGLLSAIELVKDKRTKDPLTSLPSTETLLKEKMAELGLLTRVERDVFLTPPLIVTNEDVDAMVDILDHSISYVEKQLGLA